MKKQLLTKIRQKKGSTEEVEPEGLGLENPKFTWS